MLDLSFMESWNLIPLYVVLTFLGAGLAIDNMTLRAHGRLGDSDDLVFHWLHRIIIGVIALTFLISLSYATQKGWQPWGPDLLMRMAVCAWLLISSVAVRLREHNIVLMPNRRDRQKYGWGFAAHTGKGRAVKGY